MSIATRLNRLAPTLSPRERFLLTLRAHAAGRTPDPEWKQLDGLAERREYDGYVALCVAANNELGMALHALAILAPDIESRVDLADLLIRAAQQLEGQQGLPAPRRPVRHWQNKTTISESLLLRGLAEEVREAIRQDVTLRWQELRAMEIVWAEVAVELDGVDPRNPELVSLFGETAERLKALFERVARHRRLPEPQDETLAECALGSRLLSPTLASRTRTREHRRTTE